jgi:hypothetical protein
MADEKEYVEAKENRFISRVSMGDSFETNEAIIRHTLDDTLTKAAAAEIIAALPSYSVKAKKRDTQVGGNEAINCYYQFNESDDIVHTINKVGMTDDAGMGRVYNETFDQQQQILYMTFGVPDFTNAANFVSTLYDQNLATLMNTGDASVLNKVGQFIGYAIGTALTIPITGPIKIVSKILAEPSPSKYYDILPTMPLYYKTVNVILAHLASNMNLIPGEDGGSTEGVPNILKTHGLDILTILSRKYFYDQIAESSAPTTDELMKTLSGDKDYEKNIWEKGKDGISAAVTEALLHVGFRVEKSSDSSESASNATKEPEILSKLNAEVSAGRERTFNLGAIRETGAGQVLDSLYQSLMGFAQGMAESINVHGGAEILKGSGFVDMPEIYASSSFSKSYSFNFQLRTPYGDPYSIFYSLYIPLAMLLAAAFPRSVGQNTYTSPFLVRAYCQGMFAIPMGIIDSIHIQRGAAEYGWNDDMLPTQIDVSFTIKDLSPIMHIAIADGGVKDWMGILGENSSFQEYMLTLGGANVAQRILKLQQIKNRTKALLKILSNNKLNPMMMGFSIMNTKVGRMITKLNPVSRVPGAVTNPEG